MNIEKRREHKRQYMANKRQNPDFVKREKEYYKKWYKEYGRNRAIDYVEAIIEWRRNHPDAIKATKALNYALRTGKVIKADRCSICYQQKRLSAHHSDYSKPLEVLWVCSSCHKKIHTSP